jgi:putative ABC transport system permease protein
MFRREWRQQLAVVALLTVAVAAAVAGAAMASQTGDEAGRLGDARALIHVDNTNAAQARSVVDAARQRFGDLEVIRHATVAVPGSPVPLDVRSQDPHGLFGAPMLGLRHGRYPTSPDEVALTADTARLLDTELGGEVELLRRPLDVVGIVENPSDLADDFALLQPESSAPADSLILLAASAHPDTTVSPPPDDLPPFRVEAVGSSANQIVVTILVLDTLAMALVCLVASAGFVVVAQRRQRQLGLLAAIGADDRHLRLVMLVNGALVGAVAAVVGGVLGLLGWTLAQPAVERAVGHRVDRFDLPWVLLAECLALAVVGGPAAAGWPAPTK